MSNIKTAVRVVVSILILSVILTNGQVISRRQQFNLLRQQQQQQQLAQRQLDQQQDLPLQRQEAPLSQQMEERIPIMRATFERLFETVRTINEILQTLVALRARLSNPDSQLAGFGVPSSSFTN